jgi:glycerol-3-phosphate acyltransferase PlsY
VTDDTIVHAENALRVGRPEAAIALALIDIARTLRMMGLAQR